MVNPAFFLILSFWFLNVNAQVERYDIVINEIMADPSPVVGLPNSEFIELRNNSAKKIDLFRWRIIKGNTTAVISSSFIVEPDSFVVVCAKTQSAFFNLPGKVLGITSFPALVNEGDLITLAAPDGATVHAVEYSMAWYGNPLKAQGGWSLEMIDPYRPCDANNWKASINSMGGTPGTENSVFNKGGAEEMITATQCIALNEYTLLLQLNQGADSGVLSRPSQYLLTSPSQVPKSSKALPPLFNSVELQFQQPIEKKKLYLLQADSIMTCRKKRAESIKARTGLYESPSPNNMVINELLFDPPPGGADFIELYNKGESVINAKELYVSSYSTNGQASGVYPVSAHAFNIFPGDHIVLTTDTAIISRSWPLDKTMVIEVKTLPSMPDDKGNVVLLSTSGEIIERVDYDVTMHFPLLKNKEGVSLERIDYHSSSFSRDNWHSASSSCRYASPTKINSQFMKAAAAVSSIQFSPDLISPDNDGNADIMKIDYSFNEKGTLLNVHLFNDKGDFLGKIIDNLLCGTSGTFFWNGRDVKGKKLNTGMYILVAETFHLNGKREKFKKAIGIRS